MRHRMEEIYEILAQNELFLRRYVNIFVYRDGARDYNNEEDYWQAAREAMIRYLLAHNGHLDKQECGYVILRAVHDCARLSGIMVYPKNKARRLRRENKPVSYEECYWISAPGTPMEDIEANTSIQAFIQTLNDEERKAFHLRTDGKKIREISAELDHKSATSISEMLTSLKKRLVAFLNHP